MPVGSVPPRHSESVASIGLKFTTPGILAHTQKKSTQFGEYLVFEGISVDEQGRQHFLVPSSALAMPCPADKAGNGMSSMDMAYGTDASMGCTVLT
eukprot:3941925-Rhodomonas_salina.2